MAGHGSISGLWKYPQYDPNGKTPDSRGIEIFVSPQELAREIKANPNWEKSTKQVILYVCNVGVNRYNAKGEFVSYAQELADELGEGSIVLAPNGTITIGWVEENNKLKSKNLTITTNL